MAVVVRCTECRGASQVGADALGLMVVCPRCHEPFLALEEATPVAKPARRLEPVRSPSEPRPRRLRSSRPLAEPVGAPGSPDPHDAPIGTARGLPVSVLIGFALLPFAIPLLWLIGPQLLAQQPSLSLAAPAALALSASVLCLSVVFTVDWTPATRIKGVLMLVGLSYFAGLSLYFLKKDMVDRAREFFGPSEKWYEFKPPNGNYQVRLPVNPNAVQAVKDQPLPGWKLVCFKAQHNSMVGPPVQYLFGSGRDANPEAENWFDEVGKAVEAAAGDGAEISPPAAIPSTGGLPGQRWAIELSGGDLRTVQVFRANGSVYFLSVEGDRIEHDHPFARQFFDSFLLAQPAKNVK